MEQRYMLRFVMDYRGPIIGFEKSGPGWREEAEADGSVDEWFEVTLQHPTSGYRVYWGCEFPTYSIGDSWDFPSEKAARDHMLKIYSQINERLPFVVTGHNSAYKEQGHFPEVSAEIANMPTVQLPFEVDDESFFYLLLLDTKDMRDVLMLENG